MKKYDKNSNISYTLGTTITIELINKKPDFVRKIYVHSKQERNNVFNELIRICNEKKIEVIYSDKIFKNLGAKENCFIIGEFEKYNCSIKYNENTIVLVNPSNFGNLGTIIRTCIGFEIKNIAIIKKATDIFNPQTIRASMGAIFNINFEYFDSFQSYHEKTKNFLYPFMLQTNNYLHNTLINQPYSLIFGTESAGLSKDYLKIGVPIRIKHSDLIDSLNLDNAVSIALYEFTKIKH